MSDRVTLTTLPLTISLQRLITEKDGSSAASPQSALTWVWASAPLNNALMYPSLQSFPPYNTTNLALRDTSGPLVVVDRDDVKLITLR